MSLPGWFDTSFTQPRLERRHDTSAVASPMPLRA